MKSFSKAAENLDILFSKIYLEESVKKTTLLNSFFKEKINPEEIKYLKKTIDKKLRLYFTAMNEIMSSNLTRRQKEKHLDIIRESACFNLTDSSSFPYLEEAPVLKVKIFRVIEGKLLSILDGKFKRCLEELRKEPLLVKIDGVETTEAIAKILHKD